MLAGVCLRGRETPPGDWTYGEAFAETYNISRRSLLRSSRAGLQRLSLHKYCRLQEPPSRRLQYGLLHTCIESFHLSTHSILLDAQTSLNAQITDTMIQLCTLSFTYLHTSSLSGCALAPRNLFSILHVVELLVIVKVVERLMRLRRAQDVML